MKVLFSWITGFLLTASWSTIPAQEPHSGLQMELSEGSFLDLIPAGDRGAFTYRWNMSKVGNNRITLYFTFYDTDFNAQWMVPLSMEANYGLVGKSFRQEQLTLLFQKSNAKDIIIATIHTQTQQISSQPFQLYEGVQILDFTAHNTKVWLSCILNNQPVLFELDLSNQEKRTMPTGASYPVTQIMDLYYHQHQQILTYLLSLNIRQRSVLFLRSINKTGEITDIMVGPHDTYDIFSGRIFPSSEGNLIVGLFSSKNNGKPYGLFVAKQRLDELEFQHYHLFKNLPDFFRYREITTLLNTEGDDVKTKKRKTNFQALIDNVVISPQGIMVSIDLFKENYRTLNTSEKEYQSQNIDFLVRNTQAPTFTGDPQLLNNLDVIRLRNKEYFLGQAISTGFGYAHTSMVALDPEGGFVNASSLKPIGVKNNFMTFNPNLQGYDGGYGLWFQSGNQLHQIDLNSNFQLSSHRLDNNQFGTFTNSGMNKIEKWYQDQLVIWGYQQYKIDKQLKVVFYARKISMTPSSD